MAVHVDSADLHRLYVDLKPFPGLLNRELRRGVVSAAKPLKTAVQAEARTFSRRIPGSIKTKVNLSARNPSVAIIADASVAPHAGPINNRDRSGTFRHRVYGRDVWVTQTARPFFRASIRAHAGEAETAIMQVMDEMTRKAGFH